MIKQVHVPRILIVEEDADACDILSQALMHIGYEPDCVTSPKQAVRLASERTYAAIFMELVLPGISGLDLYHAFRRSVRSSRAPVVAISSYNELRHRCLEEGFAAFVPKPVELGKLRPVLAKLVPLSH